MTSADDTALFEKTKSLSTALIGDILDQLGHRHQFLPPNIVPLKGEMKIVGRAMPVQEAEYVTGTSGGVGPLSTKPFGLMMEALDGLKPNEIYIASGPAGAPPPFAMWGGLMSTRAQYLGAAGAIVNGYSRDTDEIERLGFPVWSTGLYAQDQGPRGKVIDYRCPIVVGGVLITPGDLIVADREGVLVIPRKVEAEAVEKALEKAQTENRFADAVKGGMSAKQAFEKFGVM